MTEKRKKPISKKIRETLWLKYNKHCAYCGCELPKLSDMQADHIKSVWRSELNFEEVDNSINNLRPACRQCNFYKSTWQEEDFRANIQGMLMNNLQKNFNYRLALKYGLVMKTVKLDKPIKFYYERLEEEQKLTPERKKFLASISEEERAIRNVIGYQKMIIYNNKFFLSSRILCKTVKGMKFHSDSAKREIREAKAVIKNLKKLLPAPRRYWSSFRLACNCPICNNQVIKKDDYCPCCGQKLR
ncbi:MAG: HNH endonuclease [Alphaproteobacteria bacterium]|nr:HNH endonuclease [Alphaproteobacteria bacterium]